MNALEIWPNFRGRAMDDRWASSDQFACAQSLCGAHVFRDCLFVAEQEHQPRGQQMGALLLVMDQTANQWRQQGATTLPKIVRDDLLAQSFEILAKGFAVPSLQASPDGMPKQPGRKKQDASQNLRDALLVRAEEVLAFLDDLTPPFPNTLAEKDLLMIKVQHKSSGTFRRCNGATAISHHSQLPVTHEKTRPIHAFRPCRRLSGNPVLSDLESGVLSSYL